MSLHLDINSLLETPSDARDAEWEKAFLHLFPTVNLQILDESAQQGPDGFPYLLVSIDNEATESATKVLAWLADKGIGLVVNPGQTMPDFVFTFGQIWYFKETGRFLGDVNPQNLGQFKLDAGQKIQVGPPPDSYLPTYIRSILREFFNQIGRPEVKVLMISSDGQNYDLCFSTESMGSPASHEQRDVLEAISWFLPGHYSLALVSEKGLPEFQKL
jgi:hypothetical protein